MIFLSGLAPLLGLCRGGDLCGLYSALSQDGKLVVEDIPLVVWGLCFGKGGGVIPPPVFCLHKGVFPSGTNSAEVFSVNVLLNSRVGLQLHPIPGLNDNTRHLISMIDSPLTLILG